MTTTHTPGPWQAKDSLTRWHVTTITTPRTYNICSINAERIEQEANARLIAAAPALYAALKECMTDSQSTCMVHAGTRGREFMRQRLNTITALAQAALAQAEGREP